MIQLSLAEAAAILGLTPPTTRVAFSGISIDTRTLEPNNLFIAIPGEKVDGHDFIEMAREKGASAALVTQRMNSALPTLTVNDNVAALGKLSAAWRDQFTIPFIAITGSNGKTTLKNMVASILVAASHGDKTKVLATAGNFNNHLGLPLTLARLDPLHRYAVIEMGMNHFGEINYLTRLVKPKIALITNAAACHIEGVRNVAGVARAKAEIFHGLSQDGIAVLNRDDPFYAYWREQIDKHRCITFGFHPDADVTTLTGPDGKEALITIKTPDGQLKLKRPLLGKHNILNMLAATAATIALQIPLDAIKTGLETMLPAKGRLELHTLANGITIIDDTYNANPFSLEAAIETLATFAGKKILVLGDMKELGSEAKELHYEAGKKIRAAGIDYLFTYGELSENTATAFGDGAHHFNKQDQLLDELKPFLNNQTTILVKGSRAMQMENVVTKLVGC